MAESPAPHVLAAPARKAQRPWYLGPILGGLSAGVAIGTALFGLPHGNREPPQDTPQVATSSLGAQKADDEWRQRMEQKLDYALRELGDTRERLARIEGRLDRSK